MSTTRKNESVSTGIRTENADKDGIVHTNDQSLTEIGGKNNDDLCNRFRDKLVAKYDQRNEQVSDRGPHL